MLFDLPHILYMVISAVITAGILVICGIFLKNQKGKDIVLKSSAILTVLIHFSSLWTTYFQTGTPEAQSVMILPIYPCNICMWLLLIVSFLKNKETVFYKLISEFTFWAGTICGIIGLVLNENYGNSAIGMADYEILKGLLSHSTMILGCIYLLVGKYVKIRVFNTLSAIAGLTLFIVDGLTIIGLHKLFNLDPPNSMFLLGLPYDIPFMNTATIGVFAVLLVFGITCLVEVIAYKKEDRWYTKLKNLFKKEKNVIEVEKGE